MGSERLPIKLHVGSTNLAKLSFCGGHAEDVKKWVASLPLANTGESAKLLYLALKELSQWQTTAVSRFEALEILRPEVYTICGLLNKHFLHSSLALNPKQLKVASLSQTLHNLLADNYKLVVAQLLLEPKKLNNATLAKVLTYGIQRAISDSSQVILRAMQLYSQPAERLWLEINQLYWLAEAKRLVKLKVTDTQNRYLSTTSIHHAFIRIHLLGAAKPNNMRQKDLNLLYDCAELWAGQCQITPADDEQALFLIHLHKDTATFYRQPLSDRLKPLFRGLRVDKLVEALTQWQQDPTATKLTVPAQANEPLIAHVIQSWGTHWQRAFRRQATTGELQLCLGLSAVHYFSAKRIDFEVFQASIRPSKRPDPAGGIIPSKTEDIWAYAFDSDGGQNLRGDDIEFDALSFINKNKGDQQAEVESKYPTYQASINDASPGGYSLRWLGAVPSSLQAGELVGVHSANLNHWAVGIIRWLKQDTKTQTTNIGVELLAPKAEPGAIQLINKTGKPYPFVRTLLLPEIKAVTQAPTLLVPPIPFRAGNRVELLFTDLNGRFQLAKRITSTSSFSQFQYRSAAPSAAIIKPQSSIGLDEDNFEGIWNKL